MVSPWMKYGTVLKYLRDRGRGRRKSIGYCLKFPRASNFGPRYYFFRADSTAGMTSSSNRAGSIQWFAPELIQPQSFGCERFVRTTATDVYAYACVCLELYTGRPPFAHLPDVAAMFRVIAGDRPEQPTTISDTLWQLVTQPHGPPEPHARPSIYEIAVALQGGPAT
ncbi:hypothetical protein B0H14DRAFT_2892439, partial [Mycena olivaceomarginata]